MSLKKDVLSLAATVALLVSCSGASYAQVNNRPYAFPNSPNGQGMSIGGKQAIINEKLTGNTPDNLQRGPYGVLLDVRKGPGNSAIVTLWGSGEYAPDFRGSDFRGGNGNMRAGTFNPYFGVIYNNNNNSYGNYLDPQTAAVIGAWVVNVAPLAYYDAGSPVNSWTSYVYNLND